MNSPERFPESKETNIEPDQKTFEVREKIEDKIEKTLEEPQESNEKRANEARAEVLKTAIKIEAEGKKTEKESRPSTPSRHSVLSKKQKNESYKRTMKRVQSELPAAERAFSKVIHNKVIENTSNVVGSTIARPNSILYGAISAFVLTLATYSVAKTLGYQLSGSETMLAFVIGWLIGLVIDYLKALFSSKH